MSGPKKIPKLFKGNFTEKEFRKKILSKLYIHEYRDYINEVFIRDEEGNYRLKENLGKRDIKKLKSIAKSIKSNTGFILRSKLSFIAILLGGMIIFNVLFLDKLIERAVERGLERVFEAKAELTDLNFQIFEGRIRFQSLEVANSRKPFRNLFELGEVDVHLDLHQLIRNKIVINNVKFQEIRWDTKRETSGALPGRTEKRAEVTGEQKEKTFAGVFLEDAEKVASEIIKKEMENIKTPEILDSLPEKYRGLKAKWEEILQRQRKKLENIPEIIKPVQAIKSEDIKTAEEAINAYNTVDEVYKKVKATEEELIKTYNEMRQDLNTAEKDKNSLENTIASDYQYLASFVKSPDKKGEIANVFLDHYVEKYLSNIYENFRRWNYYFEKLRPMIKRREGREPVIRDYGRNVTFPSVKVPRFWLKNMDVSVGSIEDRNLYSIEADDITSNQQIINRLTSFSIKRIKSVEEVECAGFFDRREDREKSAVFNFKSKNISFVLDEGVKALKVTKAQGLYNLDGEISFDRLNRAGGTLSLHLFDIGLDLSDKEDKIAVNIKEALAKNPVDIRVSYTVSEEGDYTFKIKSNLDKLISGIIGNLVNEWVNRTKAELLAELNSLLEAKLKKYERYYKSFISLEEDMKGDLTEINTYEQLAEKKKQELQAKIKERKGELEEKAKEQIEGKKKEGIEKLKDKIPF